MSFFISKDLDSNKTSLNNNFTDNKIQSNLKQTHLDLNLISSKTESRNRELNYGFIMFAIFHFLIVMLVICLSMTILKNPGFLEKKYNTIYSIPRFINFLLKFFLNFEEETNNIDVEGDQTLIDDLEFILKNESKLLDKITDFSKNKNLICSSMHNYSVDNNKRFTTIDADNMVKLKELDKFSQPMCDEIVEIFENEFKKIIINDPELRKINDLPFNELNENKRFCNFCLVKKPDRSHHCRKCGKCIRKMDHHCFYLYTCIGYGNYKYFLLTLFYSSVLLIFMSITLMQSLKFYLNEYGNSFHLVSFCLIYTFIICLTSLVTYFFSVHLMLLAKNQTTIENVEKEKMTRNYNKNIYDIGIIKNICSVLGGFLCWLIPYAPSTQYEGYSFEINQEVQKELKEINKLKSLDRLKI